MRLLGRLAILLSLLCFSSEAWAHASLVDAEPSDGSVLTSSPATVQLRFNETVTPAVVTLIDANGVTRDDVHVSVTDQTVVVTLPKNLPRGTEVVSYRVISADGHPVGGSLLFSIGAVTAGEAPHATTPSIAGLIWLARIGTYLGLFVGVGGVFFGAWIGSRRAGSTVIRIALFAGLGSAMASLGLQGLDALGLALGSLGMSATWKAALATSLGPSLLIAMGTMAAGLVVQKMTSLTAARAISALAVVAVGLALAATGHAATASPQWLSRPAVFMHGVGVAFWVGALLPLLAMARHGEEPLLPVLHRFSRGAVPVVGLLVLTGLTLAINQLQGFHALIGTYYGLILSTKLVLVAMLLGLAAFNRFRLTPALAANSSRSQPLVRSLMIECVIVLGILAVVAGWRFTPPPRATVAAARPPLTLHIHTDKAMFQIEVRPGRAGINTFVLQLFASDGGPLPVKEATLVLSMPQRGLEPLERKAVLGVDGDWSVQSVPLPYPGRWHVRLEALVTDFDRIALEGDLDVPAF